MKRLVLSVGENTRNPVVIVARTLQVPPLAPVFAVIAPQALIGRERDIFKIMPPPAENKPLATLRANAFSQIFSDFRWHKARRFGVF